MTDLSGHDVDNSNWTSLEDSPDSLKEIMKEFGKMYVPALLANARAIIEGEETWETEIDGSLWKQKTFPYQAKCLNWIKEEFDKLIEELDAELAEHKWIGSDSMSLADIAFAPYATRLEHLHLSAMWHHKPHFKDWYERLKRTEGYQQGLAGWFNPKYLELMDRAGAEAWPNISAMLD